MGLIPGSGRSSEGGHGNPLQYSCQENLMDRGASKATGHGVTKTEVTECTHTHTHTHTHHFSRFHIYTLNTIFGFLFLTYFTLYDNL